MRLRTTKSAHSISYSVIKSAYINKKRTTVTVEILGNEKQIRDKYHCEDALAWARTHVAELNSRSQAEESAINIPFYPAVPLEMDCRRRFNGGYLFLQQVYCELGLDRICKAVARKHRFKYNLNSILSRLVYTRILYPSSKLSSFELSSRFIEPPDFALEDIYHALSVLAEESDYIQAALYKNSTRMAKRHTGIIYYDCTNYFFEIEDASGCRQYGACKENRPLPIVEMGLFMDQDGIPLAFCINPGNTNEQKTLVPLEKKLMEDFSLSKFVVCTDAGLSSNSNRKFNDKGGRSFITTQSIKKMKRFLADWCLDPSGWHLTGSKDTYNIQGLDEGRDSDLLFYKERWINEDGLEQHLIVSYSIKYRNYLRHVRDGQIERAKKTVEENPGELARSRQTDYKRFVKKDKVTDDGEIAHRQVLSLNQEMIDKEEKYDGFYAVCTNLEDDAPAVIALNKRRWEIEECFRIMKSEFEARPVFLQRDDRIKAHFMTCFIALIVYRYLESRLGDGYTCGRILDCIKGMDLIKIEGKGYVPVYTRTQLTDALHKAAGFDTSTQIVTIEKMRNICHQTKKGIEK